MSRLLDNRWHPGTPVSARDAEPWVSSGVLTASTVIKAGPGLLGGVLVTALDDGGDVDIIMWDSPDSPAGEELCRVTVPETTALTQHTLCSPSGEGIEARNGIYLQVTGDAEVTVFYK